MDSSHNQNHWFEPIADHLQEAYLRYAFTQNTEKEVSHIVSSLNLKSGDRVLDVGCGPGILSMFAAKAGARRVVGIDFGHAFGSATYLLPVPELVGGGARLTRAITSLLAPLDTPVLLAAHAAVALDGLRQRRNDLLRLLDARAHLLEDRLLRERLPPERQHIVPAIVDDSVYVETDYEPLWPEAFSWGGAKL